MIKTSLSDIVLALTTMLIAVLGLVATFDLPAATLEPIGPAAFPKWASIILFCLGTVVLVRAVLIARTASSKKDSPPTQRYRLALWLSLLSLVYIGGMSLELFGFRWGTVVYAFALTIALFDHRPKYIPVAFVIAIALGVGLHYLFTQIFFIDLP